MDSFYTLALSLLLLLSVLAQIQMLLRHPRRLLKVFHYCPTSISNSLSEVEHSSKPEVIVHYAKKPTYADTRSGSKIFLSQLRNILSTPILRQKSILKSNKNLDCCPLTCESSSFNVTGQNLPIADISHDYKSFRYRMFKASLRNLYGDKYPPGNVIFNWMLMNLCDSETNVRKSEKDRQDYYGEIDPGVNRMVKKMKNEYLDPLNLYVARKSEKVDTMDQIVETGDEEKNGVVAKDNRRNRG